MPVDGMTVFLAYLLKFASRRDHCLAALTVLRQATADPFSNIAHCWSAEYSIPGNVNCTSLSGPYTIPVGSLSRHGRLVSLSGYTSITI